MKSFRVLRYWNMTVSVLSALPLALLLLFLLTVRTASAQNAFGTLSNFDVINDTGGPCHGFEIELEGVHKEDITWIFGAPWNRYGDPTKEDKLDAQGKVVGAYLRYRSPVDPATNQFTKTTLIPPSLLLGGSGVITPTDGHACYDGGPIGNYETSGCEHFGLGFLNGNPTNTIYHWLIEDPNHLGQLITSDTKVSIPAVTWNVQLPLDPAINPNPVVRAAIPEEPQEQWACAQFGEAQWVKVYKTEASHHVQLENLLTDNPAVPQDASETEIEWVLSQAAPTCDENGNPLPPDQQEANELVLEAPIGDGNESVTRRYEFYKYTGVYGSAEDSHEAFPINNTNPYLDALGNPILDENSNPISNGDLGDYIGAQMAAVNLIEPLMVTTAALPVGEVGVAYPPQSLVSGGVQPYSITISSGTLPSGLDLDLTTSVLSGTPTQAGSASFMIEASDTSGTAVSGNLTVTIVAPVSINTAALPAGTSGQAYSATLNAANGVSPYVWSLAAGALPVGVSLSNGNLSGTPSVTGTFTPTFRVTDALGAAVQKSLSLTIAAAPAAALTINTSSLTSGTINKSYSATLAASGGTAPYTWALTAGNLPNGITLTVSTGKLAGTPTVTGTFNLTFRVTDGKGATATKGLSLTIKTASSGSTSVEIKGSIGTINAASKYLTVGGVDIYYNSNTVFKLNTSAGQVTSTGILPAGVTVGMPTEGKGTKDATGKIIATTLEIN